MNERIMQVYKIINNITGKIYVGQTKVGIEKRWETHVHWSSKKQEYPLYADFKKFGIENFSIEVLKDNLTSQEELNYWEKYYIKQLNTKVPNGYNICDGGLGIAGYIHTDITREKLKEISIYNSQFFTTERNQKISQALKGRKFSDEHKKKISEKAKTRIGEKNSFYGKHHSDETKKIISDKAKNRGPKRKYFQIDVVTGQVLNEFETIQDAASYIVSLHITRAKQVSIEHGIYMCCIGAYNTSCGYVWKSDPVIVVKHNSKA